MTPSLDDIKKKHAATIEEMERVRGIRQFAGITDMRQFAENQYGIDPDWALSIDDVLSQVAAAIARSKPITREEIEAMEWGIHTGAIWSAMDFIMKHNRQLREIIARLPKDTK